MRKSRSDLDMTFQSVAPPTHGPSKTLRLPHTRLCIQRQAQYIFRIPRLNTLQYGTLHTESPRAHTAVEECALRYFFAARVLLGPTRRSVLVRAYSSPLVFILGRTDMEHRGCLIESRVCYWERTHRGYEYKIDTNRIVRKDRLRKLLVLMYPAKVTCRKLAVVVLL